LSNLDYQLFHLINGLGGVAPWLDSIGIFLAVHGIYVLIGAAVALALYKVHRRHFAFALFTSLISSYMIVKLIKVVTNRPRPFEVLDVNQLIADYGTGRAFSSGHAAIMFSIAFSFYGTKYFWWFLAWALMCSFARVFVGVHYPADIIASIGIAAVVVIIMRRLFKNTNLG
jgi:undecaprenyl-diphosphatase